MVHNQCGSYFNGMISMKEVICMHPKILLVAAMGFLLVMFIPQNSHAASIDLDPLANADPLMLRVLNFTCCPAGVTPNDIEVTYTANILTAGFNVLVDGKAFDTCTSTFPAADKITITCKDVIPDKALVAISTTPSTSNFKSAFWSDAKGGNIGGATPTKNEVVTIPEPGSLALLVSGLLGVAFIAGRRGRSGDRQVN